MATPAPAPSVDPAKAALDAQLAQIFAGGGGGNTLSAADQQDALPVYTGLGGYQKTNQGRQGSQGEREGRFARARKTDTYGNLKTAPYRWDRAQLKKWEDKLLNSGVIKTGQYDFQTLVKAWQSYTLEAAQFTAEGKNVSTWDVVDLDAEVNHGANADAPKTTTDVSTSIQDLDEGSALQLIKQSAASLLGRDATDAETEDFVAAAQQALRKAPTVTKTTQTVDAKGNQTSNTSTSGGVSSGDLTNIAEDQLKASPEFGKYQAGTTYFNALLDAISSPVH